MALIDFNEMARIMAPFVDDFSDNEIEQDIEQQAEEQNGQAVQHQAEAQVNREGVVASKKDKNILTYAGYQFWSERRYKEKTYWECTKVDSDNCRARLHTNTASGQVVKEVGNHSCTKSSTAILIRHISQQVKEAASNNEHPSTIFNSVLNGVPEAVQAKLDKSAVRKMVQRKRKRVTSEPEVPNGINFAISEAYKNYHFGLNDSEPFLLGDSVDADGNRLLLFGRASNKSWSAQMKVVFMDGTFKITPSPFYQVYVILAERGGYVFPVLYALLVNKSQTTYERLLNMIRDIWPEFNPKSISVDFEMTVIKAIEICFPDSEIWGCLFHLVQNLKKNLCKQGLKGRYESDPDFAVLCRMITAMAFIPPDGVMPVFEELWDLLPMELEPILVWMQKNYIDEEIEEVRELLYNLLKDYPAGVTSTFLEEQYKKKYVETRIASPLPKEWLRYIKLADEFEVKHQASFTMVYIVNVDSMASSNHSKWPMTEELHLEDVSLVVDVPEPTFNSSLLIADKSLQSLSNIQCSSDAKCAGCFAISSKLEPMSLSSLPKVGAPVKVSVVSAMDPENIFVRLCLWDPVPDYLYSALSRISNENFEKPDAEVAAGELYAAKVNACWERVQTIRRSATNRTNKYWVVFAVDIGLFHILHESELRPLSVEVEAFKRFFGQMQITALRDGWISITDCHRTMSNRIKGSTGDGASDTEPSWHLWKATSFLRTQNRVRSDLHGVHPVDGRSNEYELQNEHTSSPLKWSKEAQQALIKLLSYSQPADVEFIPHKEWSYENTCISNSVPTSTGKLIVNGEDIGAKLVQNGVASNN